jgi:hypothetical protein
MADHSENTPFLADNDHGNNYDESQGDFIKVSPANSHFRRPIRILTGIISFLSLSVFGLLVASYVLLKVAPFQYTWGPQEAIRGLAICVSISSVIAPAKEFPQSTKAYFLSLAVRKLPPHGTHDLLSNPNTHQHCCPYRNVDCDCALLRGCICGWLAGFQHVSTMEPADTTRAV